MFIVRKIITQRTKILSQADLFLGFISANVYTFILVNNVPEIGNIDLSEKFASSAVFFIWLFIVLLDK